MDSAIKTARKYPCYTTAELEASVAAGRGTDEMVAEITARKSGVSVTFVTPQVPTAGRIMTKVGRL